MLIPSSKSSKLLDPLLEDPPDSPATSKYKGTTGPIWIHFARWKCRLSPKGQRDVNRKRALSLYKDPQGHPDGRLANRILIKRLFFRRSSNICTCVAISQKIITPKILFKFHAVFLHSSFVSHFCQRQWNENLFLADHPPWVTDSKMVSYADEDDLGAAKCVHNGEL